jgi:methyl-accepting chemotaxis protein
MSRSNLRDWSSDVCSSDLGFAVVAAEVRNLAQRSAEAAKEIKGLIMASVERVEQGTALVDQAGSTMHEVVTSIRRVTDIVGEISSASTEQNAGVSQVSEAVSQMDQATQQNAALVEESAAAAASLKTQSQQLVQAVSVFKLSGHAAASRSAPAASLSAPPTRFETPAPRVLKTVDKPAIPKLGAPSKPASSTRLAAPARPSAPKLAAPAKAAPSTPGRISSPPAGGNEDWESF